MNDCRFGYRQRCRYLAHADRSMVDYTRSIGNRAEYLPPDQQGALLAIGTPAVCIVHRHPFSREKHLRRYRSPDEVSFGRGEVSDRVVNFIPWSNQGGAAGELQKPQPTFGSNCGHAAKPCYQFLRSN